MRAVVYSIQGEVPYSTLVARAVASGMAGSLVEERSKLCWRPQAQDRVQATPAWDKEAAKHQLIQALGLKCLVLDP